MSDLLIGTALGLGGGFIRVLAGMVKQRKINWHKKSIILTLVAGAVIGLLTAVIVSESYIYAALTGYVGADLLDNFFKKST